jgi:hypothetical protein
VAPSGDAQHCRTGNNGGRFLLRVHSPSITTPPVQNACCHALPRDEHASCTHTQRDELLDECVLLAQDALLHAISSVSPPSREHAKLRSALAEREGAEGKKLDEEGSLSHSRQVVSSSRQVRKMTMLLDCIEDVQLRKDVGHAKKTSRLSSRVQTSSEGEMDEGGRRGKNVERQGAASTQSRNLGGVERLGSTSTRSRDVWKVWPRVLK